MKHFFIINPAAGKGTSMLEVAKNIKFSCEQNNVEYEIHYTSAPGEAITYIKNILNSTSEKCRFYACGGDGTINEVVNGIAEFDNAELGIIPIGTGNDFVRNFDNGENFFDIDAQINGEVEILDLIKYNDKYSSNMINIGFDCEVVKVVSEIKRNPLVPKSLAFPFGVVNKLIKMPGTNLKVFIDGEKQSISKMLLCCIGNGGYCGGGFHSAPLSSLCDGIIDICMVKPVSRLKFIALVSKYKAGTHLTEIKDKTIVTYKQCKEIVMNFDKPTDICVDGEIETVNELKLSAVKGALKFAVPRGSKLIDFTGEKKETANV